MSNYSTHDHLASDDCRGGAAASEGTAAEIADGAQDGMDLPAVEAEDNDSDSEHEPDDDLGRLVRAVDVAAHRDQGGGLLFSATRAGAYYSSRE